MKAGIHFPFILLFAILNLNFLYAQNFWEQVPGPEGGTIRCYTIDGTGRIYIGTNGSGVYYSTINGSSWVQTVQGIIEGRINTLAVTSNDYVFAATDRALYRSTNNVTNWIDIAFQGIPVYSMVIDAANRIFVSAQNTIKVSTDSGVTWSISGSGLPSSTLYSLTAGTNGNLYVRTSNSVFRSIDNGANWTAINNGLQLGYTSALNALANNTLFCGISSVGVFRSTDNGDNWTLSNSGITDNRVFCFGGNSTYVYTGTATGVFRSSNNGDNWVLMNSGFTNPYVGVNVIFYKSNNLFAGTGGVGILKSTNDGGNWARSNSGLNACAVKSVDFTTSGNIVTGLTGGVFVSSDNGLSWIQSDEGITNTLINVVRVHPNGTFFAGSFPLTGTPLSGVFRSTNNGVSWAVAMSGFTYTYNNVLDFVFNSAGDIFAGTNDNVYKSTNNGDNWFRANNGLTNSQVYALAINYQNGYIFAGTFGGGMFLSTNNGDSWTGINNGLTTNAIMDLAINSDGDIFAGTYGSVVFRSTDNGNHWEQVLSANLLQTWSVTINSADVVFAGVLGGLFTDLGCWRSTNNGDNWEQLNTGLFDPFVQSLGVSSSGFVFAGTFGGLYRSVESTTGVVSANEVPSSFRLYQNYPNPFNPVTKIKFSLPNSSKRRVNSVRLVIYDELGREVETLIPPLRGAQDGLSTGTYEVTWDASNYPSGVYFYRLVMADASAPLSITKKMILLK
jgi:photosystem II stability/assembly factor-like uncharacterized protein